MIKRVIAAALAMALTAITATAQTDTLNQRVEKYGFEARNLTNVQCIPEASPDRPWHAVCISNTRERMHTVVAWKRPTFKKLDVQMSFGGDMLHAKGETVSWNMNCKSDPSFTDPTGMNGSIVDCSWTSPDAGKQIVYATFFYFIPNPGSGIENVLIFSDFGKGDSADETKSRARTFLAGNNLVKLQK